MPINQGWEGNAVTIEMQSDVDIENGTPSTLQTRKKFSTSLNGESGAEENADDASFDKRRVRTTFNRSMVCLLIFLLFQLSFSLLSVLIKKGKKFEIILIKRATCIVSELNF